MAILADENVRVIVQGITGREASTFTKDMMDYGTHVVAGVTPGNLAILEHDQRWHGLDLVVVRDLGVRINVDFHDLDLAGHFLADFFEGRRHGLARAAPFRMKIDQYRL